MKKESPQRLTLNDHIEALLDTPDLENSIIGIAVQSSQMDDYLYLKNENTSFVPASNLKLLP